MCFRIRIFFLTGSEVPLYLDLYSKSRKIPVMTTMSKEHIPSQKNTFITSRSEDARSVPCAELALLSSKQITKTVLIHSPVNRSWAKLFIMVNQVFNPPPVADKVNPLYIMSV